MRTARQNNIRRALLKALSVIPEGFTLRDDLLRGEAARLIPAPAPTTAEMDAEIHLCDIGRFFTALPDDEGTQYQITTAGRIWLAQHP